jgi:hypothetical protein
MRIKLPSNFHDIGVLFMSLKKEDGIGTGRDQLVACHPCLGGNGLHQFTRYPLSTQFLPDMSMDDVPGSVRIGLDIFGNTILPVDPADEPAPVRLKFDFDRVHRNLLFQVLFFDNPVFFHYITSPHKTPIRTE